MKILYVSSNHPSLEYDDLSMLTALGMDWFSTGVYSDPKNPLKSLQTRPPINKKIDNGLLSQFKKLNRSYIPFENSTINLSKEFVDNFDVVWVTHTFYNIDYNWLHIKHKPVIWRTYNQQDPSWEEKAKTYKKAGLKIVRMGYTEANRLTFAGQDEVIRGYVDLEVFTGWVGNKKVVLTYNSRFQQRLNQSLNQCNKSYLKVREAFNCFELYGFENLTSISLGPVSYEKQIEKYKESMVYFSLNSESAVYTNAFMEALMTGIPVVTFGSNLSNVISNPELRNTYEVPNLVINGKEAIISDDIEEIKQEIQKLLDSPDYRIQIGNSGRQKAMKLFNKEVIFDQWKNFLQTL